MSIFTPYVGTPPDPNYLGYSKSPEKIEPNKTWGNLLENAGSMVDIGIKGYDELERKNIEKEANERLSQAQDDEVTRLQQIHNKISGGKVPGTTIPDTTANDADRERSQERVNVDEVSGQRRTNVGAEEPDAQPLPPAATNQLNYLSKISQAGVNGKLTGTGVQMNGEAILSDLLQRYPSRATQIRSLASKYGFGEGRYAAQLRTEINQFQQQVTAKDNRDEAWENHNREYLAAIDPNYFNRPKEERRSQDARDFYQTKIGNIEWVKKSNEIQKGQLDLDVAKTKEEELTQKTDRVWTDRRATDFAVKFEGLTSQVLGTAGVNNLDDFMTKLRESGKYLNDPKFREELGSKLEQFKMAFKDESVRLASREKIGKEGGKQYTYLQLLKKEGLNNADDTVLTAISSLQKWVDSKGAGASFDAANSDARIATAKLDAAKRKMADDNPITTKIEAWRGAVGEQVWGQQYINAQGALRMPVDNAMNLALDIQTNRTGTGTVDEKTKKPETLGDTLYRYSNTWEINGKGGQIKPQDLAAFMDRAKNNLMNTNFDNDTAIKFGKYFFTDKQLFNQFNDSDKRKFLNTYTNPAVTDRIYNLGDPELIDHYKTTVQNMVVATTHETVSNLKKVQDTGKESGRLSAYDVTQYYNLNFDPKSNKVTATYSPNEEILSKSIIKRPNGVDTVDRAAYAEAVKKLDIVKDSVSKLNQVLSVYTPILQREKTTISPEITTMFEQMGIKLPVKEGDGKRSEVEGSTNVADITNINPATLQMQTPPPKVKTKINPSYPTGVKIQGPLGFADEQLPSSGSLDSFVNNPAATAKTVRPIEKGNIDLTNRPVALQPDGKISTENSIDVALVKDKAVLGGPESNPRVLIPTIVNGKQVSDEEAVKHFNKTKEHLGKFKNSQEASAYAEALHNSQDQAYSARLGQNISDNPIMSIKTDNIPEGMSARDFIKSLQEERRSSYQGITDRFNKGRGNSDPISRLEDRP